jgi:hypothetical protein
MAVLVLMRYQKRAAVFSGVGLLAIWLAAAASTRPSGDRTATTRSNAEVPRDPVADDLNAQAERMNHRAGSAATPRPPGRNPFEFGPRSKLTATAPAIPTPVMPLTPPPPPKPAFTLVAIGQTGDTRTAIVSAFDQVLLLKVGDQIGSRFTVAAIGADAVELTDSLDNTPVRLGLR